MLALPEQKGTISPKHETTSTGTPLWTRVNTPEHLSEGLIGTTSLPSTDFGWSLSVDVGDARIHHWEARCRSFLLVKEQSKVVSVTLFHHGAHQRGRYCCQRDKRRQRCR